MTSHSPALGAGTTPGHAETGRLRQQTGHHTIAALYDVQLEVAAGEEYVHLAVRPSGARYTPVTRALEHQARNAKEAVLL